MKWIVRVMVALLTFLVGVVSSQLWSRGEHKIVKTSTITVFVDPPRMPVAAVEWRKIVVKDRFSFNIPSYLNEDGRSADQEVVSGTFSKPNYERSGLFYVSYISHQEAEQDPTKGQDRYRATTRADITVDGKRGHMLIEFPGEGEIWSIKEIPEVKVYFPDIGEGRKLYMTFAAGFDGEGIPVAQRVIDSIKFHDQLPSHVDWRRKN